MSICIRICRDKAPRKLRKVYKPRLARPGGWARECDISRRRIELGPTPEAPSWGVVELGRGTGLSSGGVEQPKGTFLYAVARTRQRSVGFFFAVLGLGVCSAVASAVIVPPADSPVWVRSVYGMVTLLVAIAAILVLAFAWSFLRAPWEQRDAERAVAATLEAENIRLKAPPAAPALRLADHLDTDSIVNCWRLRVWNDSATAAEIWVELAWIADPDNKPLVDESQLPIELAWTSHEWGPRTLSSQDALGQTVAVLCLTERANSAEAEVYVYGRGDRRSIGRVHQRLKGKNIHVTITAKAPTFPDVQPVEHRYVLRWDEKAPLLFVPS